MPEQEKRSGQRARRRDDTEVKRSFVIDEDKGEPSNLNPRSSYYLTDSEVLHKDVAMRNLAFWINGIIHEKINADKNFDELFSDIFGAVQSVRLNKPKFLEHIKEWSFNRYAYEYARWERKRKDYLDKRLLSLMTINHYAAQKLGVMEIDADTKLVLPGTALNPEYRDDIIRMLEDQYSLKEHIPGYKPNDILNKAAEWFTHTVIWNEKGNSNCQKIIKILEKYEGASLVTKASTTDEVFKLINFYANDEIFKEEFKIEINTFVNNHVFLTAFIYYGILEPLGRMINDPRSELTCLNTIIITDAHPKTGDDRSPHIVYERLWEAMVEKFTAHLQETLVIAKDLETNPEYRDIWQSSSIIWHTPIKEMGWRNNKRFFRTFIELVYDRHIWRPGRK